MRRLSLAATAICIALFAGVVLVPFAAADWPMARFNPANTGAGTGDPVVNPVQLWSFTPPTSANRVIDRWTSPAVVNGVVYIGERSHYTIPGEKPGEPIPGMPQTNPPQHLSGGIYALNASNGDKLWNVTYDTGVGSSAVANGMIFVNVGNNFCGLNATNGDRLWGYFINGSVTPIIVGDVVYFSYYKTVYALRTADGDELWTRTFDYSLNSVGFANDALFVGCADYNVYALNAANGETLWNYSTDGMSFSAPTIVGGKVYIAANRFPTVNGTTITANSPGNFYALDATSGAKLWNFSQSSRFTSAAVNNGVIYVGCNNRNIYALDAASGVKLWNYTAIGSASAPLVTGGVVYFSSGGNNIYALNGASGDKILNYSQSGIASPVISNGVLYTGIGRTVYAFGTYAPTSSLADNNYFGMTIDGDGLIILVLFIVAVVLAAVIVVLRRKALN